VRAGELVPTAPDTWKALRLAVVRHLASLRFTGPQAATPKEAIPFPVCATPLSRPGPEFVLYYRNIVDLPALRPPGLEAPWEVLRESTKQLELTLACTPVVGQLDLGLSLLFEQRWNLLAVEIGDLASTIGLAPDEHLTIEILTSQRKLLEQKVVDSTEELRSSESTAVDKEVVNVARSASKTNSWKVDGSGSFSLGFFSLGASASTSETVTRSAQESSQRIHEQTVKSAHSLKTLHKIEVRGVTETFVQHRMTRRLRNPYPDRTMSVNVFQLQKRFSVVVQIAEIRPILVLRVALDFNEEFVAGNAGFLRENLIDEGLVEELPLAVSGASPSSMIRGNYDAAKWALWALKFLFKEPGMFRLPARLEMFGELLDPNDPAASFNEPFERFSELGNADAAIFFVRGGFRDQTAYVRASRNRKVFNLYLVLTYFYRVYESLERGGGGRVLSEQAVVFATGLAKRLGTLWTEILGGGVDQVTGDENAAQSLYDIVRQDPYEGNALTEVFRRIPGFLALMEDVVAGTVPVDAASSGSTFSSAADASTRLLHHLRCHASYYTQRYLEYLAEKTAKRPLIELVQKAIAEQRDAPELIRAFDPEGCYVDRDAVIVPGNPVDASQFGSLISLFPDSAGTTQLPDLSAGGEVVVPADGVHLEVAPGQCELPGVPYVEGAEEKTASQAGTAA
jgi:hypothetical protein